MAERSEIGEFSGEAADWDNYIERLENFFVAHDIIEANKKRATLLSVCGAATYKVIRSVVATRKPNELEYSTLVKKIQEHFVPKLSIIIKCFKFNTRVRQQGESVATYVAQLRQLTQYCEFGDSLEEMLRDCLVCRIADVRMQRALLAEPQLTFMKTLQMIQTMETADRDSRELQAQITGPVPMNTVARMQATATKPCFHCREQHSPATCHFKDFVCNFCKKTFHIMRACRSKQRAGNNQQLRRSEGDTHHVTATEQEDNYSLFNIKGLGHQPFYMTLTVQGKQL